MYERVCISVYHHRGKYIGKTNHMVDDDINSTEMTISPYHHHHHHHLGRILSGFFFAFDVFHYGCLVEIKKKDDAILSTILIMIVDKSENRIKKKIINPLVMKDHMALEIKDTFFLLLSLSSLWSSSLLICKWICKKNIIDELIKISKEKQWH